MAKKGVKFTEEHKRNLSISHKGCRHSEETKKRMSLSHKGNNHGFQKGHTFWKDKKRPNLHSEEYKKEVSKRFSGENNHRYVGAMYSKFKIKRLEWFAIRNFVLERDLFKCQHCGRNHHEVRLDVHHIIPFRISQDNSQNNLMTLCINCHSKLHQILIQKERMKQ